VSVPVSAKAFLRTFEELLAIFGQYENCLLMIECCPCSKGIKMDITCLVEALDIDQLKAVKFDFFAVVCYISEIQCLEYVEESWDGTG